MNNDQLITLPIVGDYYDNTKAPNSAYIVSRFNKHTGIVELSHQFKDKRIDIDLDDFNYYIITKTLVHQPFRTNPLYGILNE